MNKLARPYRKKIRGSIDLDRTLGLGLGPVPLRGPSLDYLPDCPRHVVAVRPVPNLYLLHTCPFIAADRALLDPNDGRPLLFLVAQYHPPAQFKQSIRPKPSTSNLPLNEFPFPSLGIDFGRVRGKQFKRNTLETRNGAQAPLHGTGNNGRIAVDRPRHPRPWCSRNRGRCRDRHGSFLPYDFSAVARSPAPDPLLHHRQPHETIRGNPIWDGVGFSSSFLLPFRTYRLA